MRGRLLVVGVVFGCVGVGAVTPVVDHPHGVGEAQRRALLDEHLLMLGEHGVAPVLVGSCEQVDMIQRQPTIHHRRQGVGHRGEVAGPAQLDLGGTHGDVAVAGEAGVGGA